MSDPSGVTAASAGSQQQDGARRPLHTVLPPLILGTATFNTQYVDDPEAMPYRGIVARAIELGVNAFDTSPYYGPSETLLGNALDDLMHPVPTESNPMPVPLPRSSFSIITKAGRVASQEFDYSPAYIRYSVLRSLQRLHTPYLDLVYTHDVEFVSPQEVVAAVRELRRLRDEEGIIRYVGISGFPVDVLCDLAQMVYAETGEPLDAVMSYGHFTVQNRKLGLPWVEGNVEGRNDEGNPLARLRAAGVDVVLNASMLGMGLLTSRGILADAESSADTMGATETTSSPIAKWHPSPPELRLACKELAGIAAAAGERLESVAIRWALEEWARVGAVAAVGVSIPVSASGSPTSRRVGPTVFGVTSIAELEETVAEWREVLSGFQRQSPDRRPPGAGEPYSSPRQEKILKLVQGQFWPALKSWVDFSWDSPRKGYVNRRQADDMGSIPDDGIVAAYERSRTGKS